jgi:5'-nucleotidase / UDP-sugar diphosphatase
MQRTVSLWLFALSLVFSGCTSAEGPVRSLTILHTNDLHARFLPDERGRGGFAHLATAIERERKNSETAIVLLAGDLVQGTPVSSIYEGVPCYEVAAAMGFDANVLGNHEFDYTWRKIPEFIAASNFPTVTANVVNEAGELLAPEPYVILERDGLRIAVIGVLMEDLDRVTKGNQRGPWRLLPAAETARKYARRLRDDVDLVVVLAHLFDDEELEILEGVPEIDVLVGGHNHRGQTRPNVVDGRIGVKVGANGRELGRLDLEIDTGRKKVVSHNWQRIPILARKFPADPRVQQLVDKWESKVATVVDVPIGRATRNFGKGEVVDLIEQAMMDAVGADMAYMNAGGTRDVIHRGEILVRHVWQILPFGNQLVYARLNGRELPSAFRKGRNINPSQTYTVATNDFIAEQMRSRGDADIAIPGPLVREALIDYIKQKRILK